MSLRSAKPAVIRLWAPLALIALTGAAPAEVAKGPPTPVSELVVAGGPAPKVVSSYPADASEIPAGVLVIKLVFDQPMTADGWSYARSDGGEFPTCLERPRLLSDQRTFVLLCSVAAHKTYALEVNASAAFLSASGRLAKPSRLGFTTGDTGVANLHDALEKAGLTDADEPIMTWKDGGAGVSQSKPPAH